MNYPHLFTFELGGVKAWTTTKRGDSKIQTMEIKFLIAILNKTKGQDDKY